MGWAGEGTRLTRCATLASPHFFEVRCHGPERIRQHQAEFDPTRPKFGRCRANFVDSWPCWAEIGRKRWTSTNIWPSPGQMLVGSGLSFTEMCEVRPKLFSDLGPIEIAPTVARNRQRAIDNARPHCDRASTSCEHVRPKLARFGQNPACMPTMCMAHLPERELGNMAHCAPQRGRLKHVRALVWRFGAGRNWIQQSSPKASRQKTHIPHEQDRARPSPSIIHAARAANGQNPRKEMDNHPHHSHSQSHWTACPRPPGSTDRRRPRTNNGGASKTQKETSRSSMV